MNRFHSLFRWAWSFIVVFALAFSLSGCEGDDGAPGADGSPGAAGPTGPTGPEGPAGPGASIIPLESCGVCHDDGSFASAPDYHALDPIESVRDVAFEVVDADLVVTFNIFVDGVLTEGYNNPQRGYRNDGTTRTTITDSLSLVDLGGGSYELTVAGGAAFADVPSRYLFRVFIGASTSDPTYRPTRVYFYGDFPASPFEAPPIVSAAACTACHGPEGIGAHGGPFQEEDGIEPCLACHGTGTVPDLFEFGHAVHSNILEEDGELIHVTYPTYMNNCSVCHAEPAELAAANALPVSGGCFTCHGTMDSFADHFLADPDTGKPDYSFHLTLTPTPETANCASCHNDVDGIAAGKLVVTDSHDGLTTERGGVIVGGADLSVTEGAKFAWAITDVEDDGTDLTITWQASYGEGGVNPCNATLAVGEPVFFVNNRLRIYRSYAQGDDFIMGMSTSSPGQASSVNVDDTNTTCASNIATTVIPVDAMDAEKGRIAMGGRPLTLVGTTQVAARAPSLTYDWLVGVGGPAPARRAIVDTNLCLGCHVGSLYQHGGDRIDNVDLCLVCHNAASNEKNVRTATMGIDPADTYDGRTGQTFELKTMLHRIHSAGERDQTPYVIYRGRGVYAFAPEGTELPNWPGEGSQDVYGSTIDNDGNPGVYNTPHHFHSPTWPRSLNECTACHVSGSVDFQPDQTQAMASTQDAGGSDWADQTDDVLQGAATTACVTCHAGGAAKGHAYQNSWQPQEFEEGRQTIIDAVN